MCVRLCVRLRLCVCVLTSMSTCMSVVYVRSVSVNRTLFDTLFMHVIQTNNISFVCRRYGEINDDGCRFQALREQANAKWE